MDKKYYILGGIVILLLILAGVLFLSSNGKSPNTSNSRVELTWWKTFETNDNIQDLAQDYQRLHKNVTINFVKKDVTTYEQDLVNAIASGSGPDIFSIHNDWLPKHQDKIAPMPDTVMSLRTYKDSFVDVAYSDFVLNNKIYAIPLSTDVLALYYNKDLLNSAGISQPPTTWRELVTDVEKLTKVSTPGSFDKSGIALGTSANVNRAVDILSLLMLQNGTEFYDANNSSATFANSQTIEGSSDSFNPGELALMYYTQFANPGKVSYTWNTKSDASVDAFTQGKVAMMINYSYMIPTIKDKAPNLNWDVAAVPQTSETGNKINFANYWGEAVSKSSKNSAVAWDFLNFISQKSELTKYYAKHKQVSSRKDMLPDQASDIDIGVFAENALTARSVYKKDANQFEAVFLNMIDDVILRNLEAKDALQNAVQQINLTLQKN
ncbi:MAG TPA: sugar ABC transporter substrate-binding protein [Methylomirabilota bacterium]|nr:sugar ABC transporter substrate-binding protein [Methylomirabilota bacterium]